MHIVFPIGAFYPDQAGGPASSTYWIAKAAHKRGVEGSVVTTTRGLNNKFPIDKWNNVDGIKTRYCSGKNLYLNRRMIWNSFKEIKKADIVQLSSIFYPANLFFSIYSCILGRPVIWSTRGELAPTMRNNTLLKKIWKRTIKLYAHKIVFHCTAESERKEILDVFGKNTKIIQIPNYMETVKKLDIPYKHYLLTLGRIHPKKAIENLIEALSLSENFIKSDFKLLIVGDDKASSAVNYVAELKDLIEKLNLRDKVFFKGPVYGEKKYEYYAQAYCTFLVSHNENFGNVVIESLSQGTPVIASTGTPWRILSDANLGDWVYNDPKSIAKSINKILEQNTNDYDAMRLRCQQFCADNYSIDSHINEWIDNYHKILR